MSHTRPIVDCLRCHRTRKHHARGLCASCFIITGQNGTRDQFPRQRRRDVDTLEDYLFLREQGCDEQEVVQRLGVRVDDLRRLVRKAQV